jgi:hypothetical protein
MAETWRPAFKNTKGFVTMHIGLGCMLIPLAKSPKGSISTTPNAKNIKTRDTSRRVRRTQDFIKSARPKTQKMAPIQTRGSNHTSKKPSGLLTATSSATTLELISVSSATIPANNTVFRAHEMVFPDIDSSHVIF